MNDIKTEDTNNSFYPISLNSEMETILTKLNTCVQIDTEIEGYLIKSKKAGDFTNIYDACKNDDAKNCNYIVKETGIFTEFDLQAFKMEALLNKHAGEVEIGYGTNVVFSGYCKASKEDRKKGFRYRGILIMEKMDYSLVDILFKGIDNKEYENYIMLHPEIIFEPIKKMFADQVFHGDLYLKNLMIKKITDQDGNVSYIIKIIDFGTSLPFRKLPKELKACDLMGLLYGEVGCNQKGHDIFNYINFEDQFDTLKSYLIDHLSDFGLTKEDLQNGLRLKVMKGADLNDTGNNWSKKRQSFLMSSDLNSFFPDVKEFFQIINENLTIGFKKKITLDVLNNAVLYTIMERRAIACSITTGVDIPFTLPS